MDNRVTGVNDSTARLAKAAENITFTTCRECSKRYTSDCPLSSSLQLKQPDDWFCADGQRNGGNNATD